MPLEEDVRGYSRLIMSKGWEVGLILVSPEGEWVLTSGLKRIN